MMPRTLLAGALACCACVSHSIHAADVRWRVAVSASDANISLPQLPASHGVIGANFSDGGAGVLGFQLRPFNSNSPDGNWLERGGVLAPYAQTAATGALGPSRSGAESNHVFRWIAYGDASDGGARAFGASAGDPANSNTSSTGIWLWNGGRNTEIARIGVDGPLGPGLGSGVIYKSLHHVDDTDNEVNVWMLPNRRVVFGGRIGTASTLGSDGLSVYTPGSGNAPCLMMGSTDNDVGPGIATGVFNSIGSRKTISPRGEVYAMASVRPVSGSPPGWYGSDGIWQFCDGAPRMGVLTGFTGEYGPGIPGNDDAVFGGDNNGLWSYIAPSLPGSYFFSSGGRMSTASGAAAYFGLFHHDAAARRNRPLLFENSEGQYGPQISGYVFHTSVVPYNIKAAGRYGALLTTISPVGGSSTTTGLWRLTVDGGVEPVAVAGDSGAYAPAPGRIWTGTFYRFAVFDNGDIVASADTRNTATGVTAPSWWRLSRGAAPVEILKVGDLVEVPTPAGVIRRAVKSISPNYSVALPLPAGRDTWFTSNGNVLIGDVTIEGFENTSVVLRGTAARADYVFGNGMD